MFGRMFGHWLDVGRLLDVGQLVGHWMDLGWMLVGCLVGCWSDVGHVPGCMWDGLKVRWVSVRPCRPSPGPWGDQGWTHEADPAGRQGADEEQQRQRGLTACRSVLKVHLDQMSFAPVLVPLRCNWVLVVLLRNRCPLSSSLCYLSPPVQPETTGPDRDQNRPSETPGRTFYRNLPVPTRRKNQSADP